MTFASRIFIPSIIGGLSIQCAGGVVRSSGFPVIRCADIDTSNGDIYFAGEFDHVDGQVRNGCACVTRNGVLKSWAPSVFGFTGGNNVQCIRVTAAGIYLGGAFNTVNGTSTPHSVALVDTSGSLVGPWLTQANSTLGTAGVSGSANAIDVDGAGHTYWAIGQFPVCLTASGALVWNDPGNASTTIYAIKVSGSYVYIGGTFTNIGGVASLTRLTTAGGVAGGWNPNLSAGAIILAIAVDSGGAIYFAGQFTSVLGTTFACGLASVAISGPTLNAAWTPGPSGGIGFALAAAGTDVYWALDYTSFSGSAAGLVGCMDASGTNHPWDVTTANGISGVWQDVGALVSDPSNPTVAAVWVLGQFSSVLTGNLSCLRQCLAKFADRSVSPTRLAW